MGNLELLAFVEARSYAAAGNSPGARREAERLLAGEDELLHRRRLFAEGRDVPDLDDVPEEWAALARQVRGLVDLPALFIEGGVFVAPERLRGRQDGDPWVGPCLSCGGEDGLRVWSRPEDLPSRGRTRPSSSTVRSSTPNGTRPCLQI
jgi:hypothetical protein